MLKLTPKSDYAYNPYTGNKLAGDIITLTQNFPTPIIKFKVPSGVYWEIPEDPEVIMKLRKSDGTEISTEAKVIFAIKGTTDNIPTEVAKVEYSGYAYLDIKDQLNVENKDILRIDTPGAMALLPDEEFWILVNTDLAGEDVDWTKSVLEIRIEEYPYK